MRFDTYLRYDELAGALRALAEQHPHLLRVESIGKSSQEIAAQWNADFPDNLIENAPAPAAP